MHIFKISALNIALMACMAAGAMVSCNASEDDVDNDTVHVTSESVAVTNFSLSPDTRIMRNLDSVFFSIDLEHAIIYNADSLPKGTNITKLVPVIKYPNSVTSAVIEMTGGTHREGTVNYFSNANDTIDFTGDVTLTLGTSKDAITKTYTLKVNVHKEDPDTIYWDRMGEMDLPSLGKDPIAQKSVKLGSGVFSLIQESDGSYTASTTPDIFLENWTTNEVSLSFTPQIETLTSGMDGLYILDTDGNVWQSESGSSWEHVEDASGWSQIIGMYGQSLLGISNGLLVSLPEGAVPAIISMPEDFPVSGYSNPIEFSNRWTSEPTIVLFGGVTASGKLSTASWAFDGSKWTDISNTALPALDGISVVDYYSYLKSDSNSLLKEFEAYLAFGGRDSLGNLNTTVYITYDHGINWQKAQKFMQLPDDVMAGYMVDALTIGTSMQSNLSDRWKARRRLPFEIEGDVIRWDCPYIFLFGGYDADKTTLCSRIRSGVLQRLTFTPLF